MGKRVRPGVALAMVGALAGCGGGGGGGSPGGAGDGGTPVVSRAGSSDVLPRTGPGDTSAEASLNYGLRAIGADKALAAGKVGSGVTVGIVDTGIDLNHPDFVGAISPDSIDIVSGSHAQVDDVGGHGTAVAGIIGARRDGFDTVGVASGSTLLMVRADSGCTGNMRCSFDDSDLARATDYAVSKNAKILNFSLGGSSVSWDFTAALARAVANGRIVVAAAGNDGGANPINPAAWLAGAGGNGLGIAVGAVDRFNQLASFSNMAGSAKDYFLVAPGVNVVSTANGGGTQTINGTSFAAPHVTAAAAVVWAASPYLTGQQVVEILLQSATDLGAAGVDAVYGHGLVNLDAALQPVGTATVPTGATVAAGGSAASATALSLGGAFGDAGPKTLGNAVVLDSFGRPFAADLSKTVHTAPTSLGVGGWLDPSGRVTTSHMGGGTSVTVAEDDRTSAALAPHDHPGDDEPRQRFAVSTEFSGGRLAMTRGFSIGSFTGLAAAAPQTATGGLKGDVASSPYLGLAGAGAGIAAARELGDGMQFTLGLTQDGDGLPGVEPGSRRQAALAETAKRFSDGSVVGAQAGRLSEAGGPLASAASGALGFDRPADTAFTGLFAATPLGDKASLFGRWGMGLTDGSALSGGLWRDATDITSRTFALGATMDDVGGEGRRLGFTVSRPLRVSSGSALLAVPVGRTADGAILTRTERVGLTPSGAETDFELTWSLPMTAGADLVLGGLMAVEPGHVADAPPAFAVGAKYRLQW